MKWFSIRKGTETNITTTQYIVLACGGIICFFLHSFFCLPTVNLEYISPFIFLYYTHMCVCKQYNNILWVFKLYVTLYASFATCFFLPLCFWDLYSWYLFELMYFYINLLPYWGTFSVCYSFCYQMIPQTFFGVSLRLCI